MVFIFFKPLKTFEVQSLIQRLHEIFCSNHSGFKKSLEHSRPNKKSMFLCSLIGTDKIIFYLEKSLENEAG